MGGLPKVPTFVTLVQRWFPDTLTGYLADHAGQIAFHHVDAETYKSTAYVLETVAGGIWTGTVIDFDGYMVPLNWQANESSAWLEFCASRRIVYDYIAVGVTRLALL